MCYFYQVGIKIQTIKHNKHENDFKRETIKENFVILTIK